jgi:hypothetical protein
MYEDVNLISAETARQRSKDTYVRNRNEEMNKIMDEISNCVNSGKEFLRTWVKYDSTVEKLLELGYTLSSTETMESHLKNNQNNGSVWGSHADQITISW